MAYPASLDELTDGVPADNIAATTAMDDATYPHDDHHRALAVAVEAVEAELGTDPSGASATVAARFDALSSGDPTPRRVVLPSTAHYCVPTTIVDIDGAFQTSSLAQQAMWWPCYTHRAVTVAALATYCGTLEAGSTMRFGIYANTGSDLAVGSLLADFGTVSGASTGAKEVSGSQAISAGYFWVCNWQSNHSTVRWLRRSFTSGLPPSFAGVQNAYGRHFMGYKVTAVDYSAGLPASPPSLTLMDHVSDTQAAFPYWRFT